MIINSVRYRRETDNVSLIPNNPTNVVLLSGEQAFLDFTYVDTYRNPGADLSIYINSEMASSEERIENNETINRFFTLEKGFYFFDIEAVNAIGNFGSLQYRFLYDYPDTEFIISEYDQSSNSYVLSGHTYTLNQNKQFEIPPYSNGEAGLMPIRKIKAGAFSNFLKLTSVIIPETVEFIGATAFAFCRNLAEVTFLSETPPTLDGDFVFQDSEYVTILKVPAEYIDNYTSLAADENSPWRFFNGKIMSL
jgi:hypothetical protein